jgi:predicted O-methyltransferase YrrM
MAYKKPENVPGLIRNEDGIFLEAMISNLTAGDCVIEIGPFTGKSSCFMGRGIQKHPGILHLYSVDPWELLDAPITGTGLAIAQTRAQAHELFRENVVKCGMTHEITEFHGFSEDAAKRWNSPSPVGMIYVDGSHKYPMVKKDIELWAAKVRIGGYMVFDDYNSPQVKRAVDELVQDTLEYGDWIFSNEHEDTDRFAVLERAA